MTENALKAIQHSENVDVQLKAFVQYNKADALQVGCKICLLYALVYHPACTQTTCDDWLSSCAIRFSYRPAGFRGKISKFQNETHSRTFYNRLTK